ncbi:hypothetical protein C4544_05125 [candidate division WS5 bacterium]|uniref:O-antigen ligase-related domain-containing protein n=1 Tax=candidate division WS5 bacterium TaxID=2093353 RepID=A0A419DBF1_9BACT|nr:MAG: hypothetical protein C4544_05125 [candidate division WS5 bacterium]
MKISLIIISGILVISLAVLILFFNEVELSLAIMIGIVAGIITTTLIILNPFMGLLLIVIVNQFSSLFSSQFNASLGRMIGVIVAIGWFLKYFSMKRTVFFDLISFNKIAVLFIISMLVSTLLSSYPVQSIQQFFKITLLVLMVFFMQDFIDKKNKLNVFIITFALSIGIGSLFGIFQYKSLIAGTLNVGEQNIGTMIYQGADKTARVAGLRNNANDYGLMLLSGIPLLLFLSLNASNFFLKTFSAIFFVTSVVSLGLSSSRISIFGFLIYISLYVVLSLLYGKVEKKQWTLLLIIITIIVLMSSLFLYDIVTERDYSFEDDSSIVRSSLFLKAVDLFSENPLFGIGFGNIELLGRPLDKYYNVYNHPGHDLVSGTFVCIGLIGSALLIWICVRTVKYSLIALKQCRKLHDKYLLNLNITLIAAFIAFISTGFGNDVIFQRIFWIYIALAVIMHKWTSSRLISISSSSR